MDTSLRGTFYLSTSGISLFNGCRICVKIMTGENFRQFRLLFPLSFIGQFVNPVRGEEIV